MKTEPHNPAAKARIALAAYGDRNEEPVYAIRDLLTDLRHLCDELEIDYALQDRTAFRNYLSEKTSS